LRDFERRETWFERGAAAGEAVQTAQVMSLAEIALDERDFVGARKRPRGLQGNARHIASMRLLLRAERGAAPGKKCLRLSRSSPSATRSRPRSPRNTSCRRLSSCSRARRRRRRLRAALAPPSGRRPAPAARRRGGGAARDRARHALLARAILEDALAEEWSPQLVRLYVRAAARTRRREPCRGSALRASSAASAGSTSATAMPSCSRRSVAFAPKPSSGQGARFLEAALSFEESRTAHLELARLAEKMGDAEAVQRHYRRAAELA